MKMPVIFIGHGSPMNALENNPITQAWEDLSPKIPKPKAILAISAHWGGVGLRINDVSQHLPQIYDMYGFPQALYEVKYSPKGDKSLAHRVLELLSPFNAIVDDSWGIDHGVWSVLCRMYPHANIKVVVLSVNLNLPLEEQLHLGFTLSPLRDEEILIFGSGNIVHNLRFMNPNLANEGYTWAKEFDDFIKQATLNYAKKSITDFISSPSFDRRCFETNEHFIPFLNALGASSKEDKLLIINDYFCYGSISMTSYIWGDLMS